LDEQNQARIIGMAMVRGLVGTEAVREATRAGSGDLLAALLDQGLLDQTDVDVLQGLPDLSAGVPVRPAFPKPGDPDSTPDAKGLWRALEEETDGGKDVRDSFTLPRWKDYQDLRFIAEGGLGRIFAAFDPSLKRTVALKFLRRDDPELARRFVLEAQHQAKVEHPNICQVFEVGDWKGQAYIAMQFIQGDTLEAEAPRMELAEKVEVMEVVAEALHAAHRQGLIHRDVKPANIMIERREGEKPKPCVLDFGLAKGLEASGLTLQGMVIGTLHYMAPEQALGQTDRIGRRTDVYGLGATLFRVLTGRLLFQGGDSLEGLRRTAEEDPEPLSRWLPDVPRDLETIVMKCLEKAPERRYESALALAEDLRRFREGEPILARPATWTYRLGKHVRKHRSLVVFASVALIAVLGLGTWALSTSHQAREVSALAARFGTEAESMATALRMAYLLPQHDIRPHKEKVRLRMEQIRRLIREEGRLAEGPGAYALGQGHLALREYKDARRELETAWAKGYRTPEVALALGQTLGELYREGWEEHLQGSDLEMRRQRRAELTQEFRDPALVFLRLAGAMPERKAYLEGLLAYYEEDYDQAIARSAEAFRREPTLYEAKILEGNARVALGVACMDADPEAFRRMLKEAGEPYGVALDMARSDPSLLYAEAVRQCELAKQDYYYSANPGDPHEAIQHLLDRVLRVDPDLIQVYLTKASLSNAYGVFLGDHGRNPFPVLDRGIGWCEEVTQRSQGRLLSTAIQGNLHRWKALFLRDRGVDPAPSLVLAFSCFQDAISQRPGDAWIHQRMADTCSMQSDLLCARGGDPQQVLDQGLFHTKEAFRLTRSSVTAICTTNLLTSLADWQREHGRDPDPAYRQALDYCRMAISISPNDGECHTSLADAVVRYVSHLRETGAPVEAVLREGLAAGDRCVELAPTYLHLLNQGDCLRLQAQVQLDRGEDPSRTIQAAEVALRRAGDVNSEGDYALYWYQGLLATVKGAAEAAKLRSPEAAWKQAAGLLVKASHMGGAAPEPFLCRVRLAWLQGRWLQAQHRSSDMAVSEGLTLAAKGFELKPRQPELQALRGCLYLLRARSVTDGPTRRNLVDMARADLETALAQNRFLSLEFGPQLEQAKAARWATRS